MDKKHRKNTFKLAVLLVCVSLFGCALLAVQRAEWIKSDLYDEIKGAPNYLCNEIASYYSVGENQEYKTLYDPENAMGIIPSFYLAHENIVNKPFISSDVGFHSELKNNKGETVAYFQPCIVFEKNTSDVQEHEVRVLLLDDKFSEEYSGLSYTESDDLENYKSNALHALYRCSEYGKDNVDVAYNALKVDGTCDENFVYAQKLTWYEYTRHETYGYIPEKDESYKGYVDFEEWFDYAPDDFNHNISKHYIDNIEGWNKKYNQEAREMCELGFDQLEADPENFYEAYDDGLLTSSIRITSKIGNYYGENVYTYSCAYVFHPLSMAVRDLISVYIAVAVFACVAIIIVYFVMRNSYKKQQTAESNRRDLTRSIAHELKTPLAITRGYVENWDYLPEDDKEEVTRIMMNEMDHMNKMVTDLLELSHMEAGVKPVHWEDVDFYSLSSSILGRMKNIINERGLNVKLNPSDVENTDDFVAEADLEMMRIAMSNFISNAVKYAEKDIAVTLTQSNKKVRFEIENDGSTIDEKEIKKIWDEFYKSDSVNRSTMGSSGLGLAITKNIFILHNAEYGCDSNNGKVRFYFEIKKKK
ncbi:MAG: HAMP domain-containing histidine kinase [Ruminococcaceae bacterium]|nr:HAMP domain-containing histidine kinase [Oscillospiraceae bacterium]